MIVHGRDLDDAEREAWFWWLVDHKINPDFVPRQFEVELDTRTGEYIIECYKQRNGGLVIERESMEVFTVKVRRLKKKEMPKMKGINKLRSIIK